MLRQVAALWGCASLCWLTSCVDARVAVKPQTPLPQSAPAETPSEAPAQADSPSSWTPPAPATYYADQRDAPQLSSLEQEWFAHAQDAAGRSPCRLDAALVDAARRHAADLDSGAISKDADAMDHLRHALHLAGAHDYAVQPWRIPDAPDGRDRFQHFVAAHHRAWTHCGIGAPNDASGTVFWLGVHRAIDISPLPTQAPLGFRTVLQTRAATSPAQVDAYLEHPSGHIERIAPRATATAFHLSLFFGQTGRFVFELLADQGHGMETAVLLPIYVDTPVPTRPTVLPLPGDTAKDTPEDLRALINFARQRAQVPPLHADARLDAIAAAHCRDMAHSGNFGHYSQQTGFLADRLKAQRLYPHAFSENVARSSSVFRAHVNLMRSPSHKIRIVNPSDTHVGVGVLKTDNAVFITEIFAHWADAHH
ncbi:MAG: CAP domain-containing protein [Proteobacteria bacterium]|nr:CAP domain-containing protein [Pseudomonadota bacterium]